MAIFNEILKLLSVNNGIIENILEDVRLVADLQFLFWLQGNGHERDFMEDDRVYIMDVYNRGIYPHDGYAKSM